MSESHAPCAEGPRRVHRAQRSGDVKTLVDRTAAFPRRGESAHSYGLFIPPPVNHDNSGVQRSLLGGRACQNSQRCLAEAAGGRTAQSSLTMRTPGVWDPPR